MAEKTGIPALDAALKAASKSLGKEFTNKSFGDIEGMPTGSLELDDKLGIGGWPVGKIIEVFGWESSGKTSLILQCIALRQQWRKLNGITGRKDLIIDLEYSLTESFIESFGIDLEEIVWLRPDTAEEALQLALDIPKSGAIDIVLFDSVDAAQSERMLARKVGETDVGGISKEMNFALRQISKECQKQNTTYFFINQIKQNPGQLMGSPNTTTGGNALKYYAMLRLELMKGKPSKNLSGAFVMRIKQAKTKIAPPIGAKQVIELDFVYGKGFDPQYDLMMYAKQLGMLSLGSGNKIFWTPDQEESESLCTGGAKGFRLWALDPDNFTKLKDAASKWNQRVKELALLPDKPEEEESKPEEATNAS